jgi:hypothetical protein
LKAIVEVQAKLIEEQHTKVDHYDQKIAASKKEIKDLK